MNRNGKLGLTDRERGFLRAATVAHDHQRRQAPDCGPFIQHPYRVAMAVPRWLFTVAILHDVMEDTELKTPADIAELAGFALEPIEVAALMLLTHQKESVSYENYIRRMMVSAAPDSPLSIGALQAARIVKVADLDDNLASAPEDHPARPRWEWALDFIMTGEEEEVA